MILWEVESDADTDTGSTKIPGCERPSLNQLTVRALQIRLSMPPPQRGDASLPCPTWTTGRPNSAPDVRQLAPPRPFRLGAQHPGMRLGELREAQVLGATRGPGREPTPGRARPIRRPNPWR